MSARPNLDFEQLILQLSLALSPAEAKCPKQAVPLIKKMEGMHKLRNGMVYPYLCPARVPTIGYGSTGKHVTMGMQPITPATAEKWLMSTLEQFASGVAKEVPGVVTDDSRWSGLTSFVYNVGIGAFKRSRVRVYCREGRWSEAAEALLMWNKAGGKVLAGLTARRKLEAALLLHLITLLAQV